MSSKHVLHITFDMNIGGTEQVIRNLVEGLDSNRFKSSILCIDGSVGPWGKELEKKGYPVYCLSRVPGFDISLIKDIRKILRRLKVDVLHCHQYTPYVYGFFASLLMGVPVVFTEHGRFYPDVSSLKRRIVNPMLQSGTAAITAISQATKAALVEYENFSTNRIDVIYNGIADNAIAASTLMRESLGLAQNNLIMGTVSRLDSIKNQEMMLRSFHEAWREEPRFKLLIVGDGPLREALEALALELGIGDAVIFTGFQPNPQQYMALMDVFLLPSLSEGTSMTLLEAMTFSKPTIATAVGGTPEILLDRVTGILTQSNNQSELTAAMLVLGRSEALRKEYGDNARTLYQERFTLEGMADQYEVLYSKVCT